MSVPLISPQALRALLGGGGEVAVLDVREEGVFARAHLLAASNLPLSRLELGIDALVPRRSAPVVVVDDDDGLAATAAARLRGFGWTDIAILQGGVPAWREAGFELFSGVFVPSKAFGEFVEHHYNTPRISAEELASLQAAGADLVVLDSRPLDEFTLMNIPGALDCPGAELVYRVPDLAPNPETLVVVNCAGRTRSIIGAQSLINAGLPNRVVALKNGTMGWHLAGLTVERGQRREAPPPGPEGLAWARQAVQGVAARFQVPVIDLAELERLRADHTRTLYQFDVRSPEEYRRGHRGGFRSVPGGQLVQATDTFAAVRNSRLVLADRDGVRARMTASWLRQMGWRDVFVLEEPSLGAVEPEPVVVLGHPERAPTIAPGQLAGLLERPGTLLLDLARSLDFRDGHIPGARFAVRSRLGSLDLSAAERIVFTSPDGVLAALAVLDLAEGGIAAVALAGGTAAWRDEGREIVAGQVEDGCDDAWYRPYDRRSGVDDAMKDYLSWEIDLPAQIARDGLLDFRVYTA